MEENTHTQSEPPTQPKSQEEKSPSRSRASSTATERPPPSAQPQPKNEQQSNPDTEIEEEDIDPAENIQEFNWDDLIIRYHAAMGDCEADQVALMQEWEDLMNFFRVWTQAGHAQETDRTFLRLKTRVAHVQHSEQSLEKTRQHYISVVNAFESALRLLTGVSAG